MLTGTRRRLRSWFRTAATVIDARDMMLLLALVLLSAGCWHWSPALGLIVPGVVLLWLAIGPEVLQECRRPPTSGPRR